jgi:hypothetical protein
MTSVIMTYLTTAAVLVLPTFPVLVPAIITAGHPMALSRCWVPVTCTQQRDSAHANDH